MCLQRTELQATHRREFVNLIITRRVAKTAMAPAIGAAQLKLVPDVVLGDGRSSLADVFLARMASGKSAESPLVPVAHANGASNGASKTS